MNKRIGIIGDNSPEYVSILLDIWKEHNCAVIIDWRIPFNKIQEMLIDADVHKCYISKELLEKMIIISEESTLYNILNQVILNYYLIIFVTNSNLITVKMRQLYYIVLVQRVNLKV